MSRTKHIPFALLLLAFFSSLFVAGAALAVDVVVYLPGPPFLPRYAPVFLAEEKGYFKSADLNISFISTKSPDEAARKVMAREGQLIIAPSELPLIVKSTARSRLRAIAALGEKTLLHVVVHKDSGIFGFTELSDKKIAVVDKEGVSGRGLAAALTLAGVRLETVDMISSGQVGILTQFLERQVEATVLPPEQLSILTDITQDIRLLPLSNILPGLVQSIIVEAQYADARPNVVKAFVDGTIKAVNDIRLDPETSAKDYVKIFVQHSGQEDQIAALFKIYAEKIFAKEQAGLGTFNSSAMAKLARQYERLGFIADGAAARTYYTNGFARNIRF